MSNRLKGDERALVLCAVVLLLALLVAYCASKHDTSRRGL